MRVNIHPATPLQLGEDEVFCDRHEFIARAKAVCQQSGRHIAVVVLDMDRFQTVNSALGHEFGYRVLEVIGQRIHNVFSHSIALSHLGNDEFAVLLTDEDKSALRVFTQRALKAIRQPISIDQQDLVVTASGGIAFAPRDNEIAADGLLQQASIAASEAQHSGGNTCAFYTASLHREPLRRLDLELDLRQALSSDAIKVFYQPIYDLAKQKICGVEALARWKHPELGWVEPTEFIPLAEESGLIEQIGEQVLQTACRDTRQLFLQFADLSYLAVNFAARQIEHRNLVRIIERSLRRFTFPPQQLVVEITESDFLHAEARIVSSLETLQADGVRVAIDDFGTGYSSLRVLKEFPADLLKIDRQFVQQAHREHVDATITRAVIDIAHSLGMQVVAEGVENKEQLAFLETAGCNFIQGYFVGKAVSVEQLPPLLT